jgi:hypothetical protein
VARVTDPPAVQAGLLEEAVDLARRAGDRVLEAFGSDEIEISRKEDGSTVTSIDLAVERFLRSASRSASRATRSWERSSPIERERRVERGSSIRSTAPRRSLTGS